MNQNHYAIVGGSHGIGLGIVKRLVARDAAVTVVSPTNDELTGLASVTHVQADVLKDEITPEHLPDSINGLAYCPGSINLTPIRGLKPEALMVGCHRYGFSRSHDV